VKSDPKLNEQTLLSRYKKLPWQGQLTEMSGELKLIHMAQRPVSLTSLLVFQGV
jgi:hypothetical protein